MSRCSASFSLVKYSCKFGCMGVWIMVAEEVMRVEHAFVREKRGANYTEYGIIHMLTVINNCLLT